MSKPKSHRELLLVASTVIGCIAILVWDPIFFKGIDGGWFSTLRFAGYATIAMYLVALCWSLVPIRHGSLLTHVLFSGGFGALVLFAVVVIPVVLLLVLSRSFIPSFALSLVPCAIPFIAANSFRRAAVRIDGGQAYLPRIQPSLLMASLVLMLVVPTRLQLGANQFVSRRVESVIQNHPEAVVATNQLAYAFWCTQTCFCPIVRAYRNSDGQDKARLGQAYEQVVGHDISWVGLSQC